MATTNETTETLIARTVQVRNVDPNGTGEGLGSHARGTIYPLLRVALRFGWTIRWTAPPPALGAANHRTEYVDELQDLGSWLGLATGKGDDEEWVGISIDLEKDVRLGRILGYAGILISSIEDFCREHGVDAFYNSPQCKSTRTRFLVTLYGRFQYQDDPTPPVIEWMQARCLVWKRKDRDLTYIDSQSNVELSKCWRISIHIRCPEEYCTDDWKQANSITHPIRTLEQIHQSMQSLNLQPNLSIDVYTENAFTPEREKAFRRRIETFLDSFTVIHVHRQTPLLSTVQGMATADIFVPASSYLSAMAAFFCSALVVLPNEASRRTQYFAPHLQEHCPTNIVPVQETRMLTQALERMSQSKGSVEQI